MTARLLTEPARAWGATSRSAVWTLSLGGSAFVAGWLVTSPQGPRLALATAAGLSLFSLGLLAPRALLFTVICWLVALGLIRRLISELSPAGQADFLLLVAPIAVGALLVAAKERGAFLRRTKLFHAMLILSGLILLGALNPLQGSPLVGLAGLLFVFVPVLWFWIGRGLADDELLTLMKLIAGLGILVSLYGLAQTFVGFPRWDDAWIRDFGYQGLIIEGEVRSFASFSAASEYATFLGLALVIWLGLGLKVGWLPLTTAAMALLSVALIYESSRGIIFTTVLAVAVMAAAWRRLPILAAIAVGAAFILLVPFAATRLAPSDYGEGARASLVSHQVEGLADPFNSEVSSLPGHLSLLELGLRSAIANPLGIGIGPVTLAGHKFGEVRGGTEADPSNIAAALGIPGLLAYLVVLYLAFRRAYSIASQRRDSLSIVALGLLVVTILQWFNGGQYAVAFIPWLVLGWLDRQTINRDAESSAESD